MASVPPPPVEYSNYPREQGLSKRKVKAAVDAYYGYGKAILWTILFSLGTVVLHLVSSNDAYQLTIMILRWVGTGVFVAWVTYLPNQLMATAADWPDGKARTTSIIMGVISIFCFGIVAFIWGQMMAQSQMTTFRVPRKWWGFRKKDVLAYIDSLPDDSPVVSNFSL